MCSYPEVYELCQKISSTVLYARFSLILPSIFHSFFITNNIIQTGKRIRSTAIHCLFCIHKKLKTD